MRKTISKKLREKVRGKFGGRCAYCGKELGNTFHVDHVEAFAITCRKYHYHPDAAYHADREENLFPSCPRCNRWKATYSVRQFREIIETRFDSVYNRSAALRLACDFGLVESRPTKVVFWFERYE